MSESRLNFKAWHAIAQTNVSRAQVSEIKICEEKH